jgi:hypothetical protein
VQREVRPRHAAGGRGARERAERRGTRH